MAERKNIITLLLVSTVVVIVGTLVSVAAAEACTDGCYKECEIKGKKKEDVGSCTKTCDGMCRLKAATPSEKAATLKAIDKEAAAAAAAASAAATSVPGFARLKAGCIRDCGDNDLCHKASKVKADACGAWCGELCRTEVEHLASAAKMYGDSPVAEKEAVIRAIDKYASAPKDKVETLAATCIRDCSKLCDKDDPDCLAICDNGCYGRAVNLVFSLSTPARKEAIKRDIQATSARASKLVGTAY